MLTKTTDAPRPSSRIQKSGEVLHVFRADESAQLDPASAEVHWDALRNGGELLRRIGLPLNPRRPFAAMEHLAVRRDGAGYAARPPSWTSTVWQCFEAEHRRKR